MSGSGASLPGRGNIWLTTTDTSDPQGGYLNNENWGLITYNQRLKPSGQAYNELIRRLANTKGLGEVTLDGRLQACAYRRTDGRQVWLAWSRTRRTPLLVRLAASGPLVLSGMFGATRTLDPVGGLVAFETNGYPFCLEGAKDVVIGPAPAPTYIAYQDVHGVRPGAQWTVLVKPKNVWNREVELDLAIIGGDGKMLAETVARVPADGSVEVELA